MVRVESVKGVITLTDGSTSEFLVGADGFWSQWNPEGRRDGKDRLGDTVEVLDCVVQALMEDGLLASESDEED